LIVAAVFAKAHTEAVKKFEEKAIKHGPLVDSIRRSAFVFSSVYSASHEFFGHSDPDEEPLFRQRILHQSVEDFHAMMATYADRKPTCRFCSCREN